VRSSRFEPSIGPPAGLRRRKLCNRILAERPDEVHAIHLLGLIPYQSGNLGDAIEQLRRAVELAPAAALFRINPGETCRLAGRADEAVAHARRALEPNPKNPGALNNLGIALYNLGTTLRDLERPQEAVAAYSRAPAEAPNDPAALDDLALVLKRFGAAARHLNQIPDRQCGFRWA
jgi:tetratricopeptide (TPR) repeat protein